MFTDGQFYDNDLWNPYSKVTCTLMYLYSLEIGSPPLYSEINRVCRNNDETSMQTLGPFIKALGEITYKSEGYKIDYG